MANRPDPAEPGFGIYVHWPFCASKCPYCDFNSHVRNGGIDEARFRDAYLRELDFYAGIAGGRPVTSVFFGGGTPSLMEPAILAAILDKIAAAWPLSDNVEVTLEANPSSVEAGRFRAYRDAGVNRLSLGVQALDDEALAFLGRRHNLAEALDAIALARSTFPRMSFDLIYARPGQGTADWSAELRRALALSPDHLSLYQLTIEQGTPFATLRDKGKLTVPDADRAAALYEATAEIAAEGGLAAYEVSNYARPGAECRHNLTYWRSGDYLGIGAGAHGRLQLADGRHALAAERNPERWCSLVEAKANGLVVDDLLTPEEIGDEFLLMGLRLAEGVDLARFTGLSGRDLDPRRMEDLVAHRMVEATADGRLRVTMAGWTVLDAVIADLAA